MTQLGAEAVAAVSAVATAHAETTDLDGRFASEALDAMRQTGLLGLLVPRSYGGLGGTLTDLVDATIELGRADMSVAMVFGMHCQQTAVLIRHGSERLREDVLPQVAAGKVYLASVTTEPGVGRGLLQSDSVTTASNGLVTVDRDAPIVTAGRHADAFLITVRKPEATSPSQVQLLFAWRDQLQVEVSGDWHGLGMRATESVPMRLAGQIPDEQVIDAPQGFRAIASTVLAPMAHIAWSAAWLGAAMGAYSRVVGHLRGPAGRTRSPASSDLLLCRLATTRSHLEVVHALLRHTVGVVESGVDLASDPPQLLLNTLKTEASERCFRAIDELIEIVGLRHGYLRHSPLGLERVFRDLRSASLNYSNDRLRLASGAHALMDSKVRLA